MGPVTLGWLLGAALALSLERGCYVWIARSPRAFRAWCARSSVAWLGDPVVVVGVLFCAFKLLQLAVFAAWCYAHGNGSLMPTSRHALVLATGVVLLLAGQLLNASVFYRLGAVGVFFGARLGHEIPWSRAFPFSVFSHPQYVGAVLSIWGLFLIMRFPHDDWSLLPALETLYYLIGGALEEHDHAQDPGDQRAPVPNPSVNQA
jgi:phosphatidyl-N-methylethanolamine N-methyltransferase